MTTLETLAEQVRLLNKLIDLLIILKKPNDETTKNAWSDELVKVAKELVPFYDLDYKGDPKFFESYYFRDVSSLSIANLMTWIVRNQERQDLPKAWAFEAILNKYNRSLLVT